jgi:hypothetical protein
MSEIIPSLDINISDTEPQQAYDDISALCTTGKTPVRLTGILLALLTQHFSSSDYIKIPELRSYIWSPDADVPEEKNLIIKTNYSISWKHIQTRPAIIVKRSEINSVQLGMGDYIGPSEDKNDGDHYARGRTGGHIIYCVATSGHVAELLGEEVADEIMEFGPKIRADLGFNIFHQTQIGEVSKVEEHNTHFAVPVGIKYSWTHTWKLVPVTPKLKTTV